MYSYITSMMYLPSTKTTVFDEIERNDYFDMEDSIELALLDFFKEYKNVKNFDFYVTNENGYMKINDSCENLTILVKNENLEKTEKIIYEILYKYTSRF